VLGFRVKILQEQYRSTYDNARNCGLTVLP
jgi:hypothetical protein